MTDDCVAILGATGQLGTDILSVFRRSGIPCWTPPKTEVNLSNAETLLNLWLEHNPSIVVNTAAFHNVPKCEDDPETAFRINTEAVGQLAVLCRHHGSALVHISTDYVFDGKKRSPYNEDDSCAPLNVYGKSKLDGEREIQAILREHWILRVSGLYGRTPCRAKAGTNFVLTMLNLAASGRQRLEVTCDEFLTPTPTEAVAEQLAAMLFGPHAKAPYGLYHCTPQGSCSWAEFASEIFRMSRNRVEVVGVPAKDNGVKRPKYSVLSNQALGALGLDVMPEWHQGLERYLTQIKAKI